MPKEMLSPPNGRTKIKAPRRLLEFRVTWRGEGWRASTFTHTRRFARLKDAQAFAAKLATRHLIVDIETRTVIAHAWGPPVRIAGGPS